MAIGAFSCAAYAGLERDMLIVSRGCAATFRCGHWPRSTYEMPCNRGVDLRQRPQTRIADNRQVSSLRAAMAVHNADIAAVFDEIAERSFWR